MIRRIAGKFSGLFYRMHLLLKRFSRKENAFTPYKMHFSAGTGLPRILHVNGNFVIGGTSQLIVDIIERSSDIYSHQVIVPALPDTLPYQRLPVTVYPVNKLDKLFARLKKEKPALVHIHYWVRPEHQYHDFGIWYAAIFRICEELGLKVIQNINVPTRPFSSASVLHNVFVSKYVQTDFDPKPLLPYSVIYPGSDLDHFNKQPEPKPGKNIGMVYRLDPDKLNEQAIEPFIEAAKLDNEIKCFIIGGGTYLDLYRKKVNEAGLSAQFSFTGYVSYKDLPAWYKKIDLFVTPVHDESFGQVTPFAMGMGLPVTGYNTGALSEILGSDETLVRYGDVHGLALMISRLVNDPEKRFELSKSNYARVKKLFGVQHMISSYRNLYEQLITGSRNNFETVEKQAL